MMAEPGRNGGARWNFAGPRADDELPDAVVRMYRESLDDDGLDFLRRGPRTAAEQLAYAQRVHPEAYRTAQRASSAAQAAFGRHEALDHRRYFVGPDRSVYLRDEAAAEPLHSSIRRGFETAVPGFRPASLNEALAEVKAPGGDRGADLQAGDTGGDALAPATATAPGWGPLYEAGPLRMKEIASWSRNATPAGAAGMEQRDRIDVLRHLRFLDGENELSGAQRALGREVYGGLVWSDSLLALQDQKLNALAERIASDPEVLDALIRWNGGNKWSTLSREQQEAVLGRVVGQLSEGLGLAAPPFRYHPLAPNLGGQYTAETRDLELNSAVLPDGDPDMLPIKAMSNAGHEVGHAWQDDLRNRWVSGALGASDPDYALGEIAALTYPFFIPLGSVEEGQYYEQLLEKWANAIKGKLYSQLRDARSPVLERPPE